LHPDKVPNIEMGYVFEELIRRFNEASNEWSEPLKLGTSG
jgi:type I restriction enzyme M protein